MLKSSSYDYIFLGAGCAGLSLLMRMFKEENLNNKKILLIDKDSKNRNDRTWCYWEKGNGFFEDIVYRQWDTVSFLSNEFSSSLSLAPYRYKMIRGIDFYRYCFDEIQKRTNVELVCAEFRDLRYEKEDVILRFAEGEFRVPRDKTQIFNSIYQVRDKNDKTIRLLQHFKGWVIETGQPSFDPKEATLMDFRVHQRHGTSFVYVLPFTDSSALIEYTLFTKELLPPLEYEKELKDYIQRILGIRDFAVKEEEFGVIPMTNEKFRFYDRGWQIGSAGGQTKASSGYTFQFIQKQSQQIAEYLAAGRSLHHLPSTPGRFKFYDNTLLHILYHGGLPGDRIFTRLFRKNKPPQVLRFLDNESSLAGELKIISSLPAIPFIKAALHQF